MADVRDWSPTASSNTDYFPEGMAPSAVNDGGRAVQAAIAKLSKDESGTLTTTGTGTAYSLALNTGPSALSDGLYFSFRANVTSGASPTLAVTPSGGAAFTAKKLKKYVTGTERDLAPGDLNASSHYLVQYDASADSGSGAYIVLNPSLPNVISVQTPSAVANVDFTGLTSTRKLRVHLRELVPATNDVYLALRMGTGASPTWQTGTTSYQYSGRFQGTGAGQDFGSGAALDNIGSLIALTKAATGQGVGNASGQNLSGWVEIDNPAGSSQQKLVRWQVGFVRSDNTAISTMGSGYYASNTPITGLRFYFSSGNYASGTLILEEVA